MSEIPRVGGVDYLEWRKAYVSSADVKAEGLPLEPTEATADKKVEREEWDYFLQAQEYIYDTQIFEQSIKHALVRGLYLSKDLQKADDFYKEYADYAAYIQHCFKKKPKIAPGAKIGGNPMDLLALAKKHPDSLELIIWLGEAARFQDVSDTFRKQALDYLLSIIPEGPIGYYHKDRKKRIAIAETLFAMAQSADFISKHGKMLLEKIIPRIKVGHRWSMLAFHLLERCNYSAQERKTLLNKILLDKSILEEARDSNLLIFAYQLTQSSRLSQDEILDICRTITKRVINGAGKHSSYRLLIYSLAYAYLNPKIDDKGAAEILGMLKQISSNFVEVAGSAAKDDYIVKELGQKGQKMVALSLALMMTAKFRPLSGPEIRRKTLMDFAKIMFSNPEAIHEDVPRDIFMNLVEFLPAEEFSNLFVEFSEYILAQPHKETKQLCRVLGVLINLIHDRDLEQNDNVQALLTWKRKHRKISASEYQKQMDGLQASRDLRRRLIAQKLNPRIKILLIAVAGPDLYTSTFEAFYSSFNINPQNIDSFLQALEATDQLFSEQKIIANFILTMGSFAKLTELIILRPAFFMRHIKNLLSETDREKLIENTFMLVSVVSNFFIDPELKSHKDTVENMLFEFQRSDKTGSISYLIKINQQHFSKANRAKADEICKDLPEFLPPNVPAEWLKGNTFKAKLFFHQGGHLGYIQRMYGGKGYGFKIRRIDNQTVQMTKTVNGIKIVLVATANCDPEEIKKTLQSDEFSLVGHRGHSYELEKTFSPWFENAGKGKLLFIGSCGGFRAIPELMETYYGNYFVATESTGRGRTNNEFLYHFMSGIAQNKKQVRKGKYGFQDLQTYITGKMPGYEKSGLVMPHHQALLLYDFLAKYETR